MYESFTYTLYKNTTTYIFRFLLICDTYGIWEFFIHAFSIYLRKVDIIIIVNDFPSLSLVETDLNCRTELTGTEKLYLDGQSWRPDKCVKCTCKRGLTFCKQESCHNVTICPYMESTEGECCPVCKGQYFTQKDQRSRSRHFKPKYKTASCWYLSIWVILLKSDPGMW